MNCEVYAEKNADWENTATNCDTLWAARTLTSTYTPDQAENYEHTHKMLHYTIIFQVFVFMQIFNLINSRKIGEGEINVFANFFNNKFFIIIFVLTILIQCALVELGGTAVKTYPLNLNQNLICLALGFLELPWGLILKFLPIKWFQCIDLKSPLPDEEEEEGADGDVKKKSTGAAVSLKRLSTQKSKSTKKNSQGTKK